jgi:hypothetical protein
MFLSPPDQIREVVRSGTDGILKAARDKVAEKSNHVQKRRLSARVWPHQDVEIRHGLRYVPQAAEVQSLNHAYHAAAPMKDLTAG